MIRLTILIALSVFTCCNSSKKAAAGQRPMVELQTGSCFGYCPIIRLTIRNNGWVEYEGKLFAEKQGLDSFQLTQAELRQVQEKVKAVNLWQYPDQIKSEIMDAPYATLAVFENGQIKKVSGSIDRPAPLLELENLIKNLAEAHGFQVTRGINPNEPPLSSRKQVIVTLKPEINAGNWIQQFTEFKFILIQRVSEANIWLVGYDSNQLNEKAVIALFKSTPEVLDVKGE